MTYKEHKIKDALPKYDPKNQRAFDILIKASNNRYYTGYAITEYGITTFHQHNGRKVLNVISWAYLPR
jgi:hypothetical protein